MDVQILQGVESPGFRPRLRGDRHRDGFGNRRAEGFRNGAAVVPSTNPLLPCRGQSDINPASAIFGNHRCMILQAPALPGSHIGVTTLSLKATL